MEMFCYMKWPIRHH
ncbi:hypothetical protein [Citrobacter farmeri]